MTKFILGVDEAKKVVSQLEPMFKGGFENLPRILFKAEDKITAYATNGESWVKVAFDCEIEEKGEFVVSGEKFADIVKNANGEKIIFFTTDDNRLSISMDKIGYRITLIETNGEYLMAPEINDLKNFVVNAQELKNAISSVMCCIDSSKQHLNCVMLHSNEGENDKIFVVATDAMRLGIANVKATLNGGQVPNLIMSKKTAEYIVAMIGESNGEIKVEYNDSIIQVSTNGIFYASKLLETNFPRYQSAIPDNKKVLEVKCSDFLSMIKSIVKVAENNNRVKLTINSDKIKISCEDNGDDASTEIDATFSDKETLELVCNFKLLMEILAKITSSIVRFQISDSSTPMIIRSVDDSTVQYVFMPLVN